MLGQCSRRYSLASSMVIPSTPGPPLFCRTRFHALTRFSRLHTSSINCSVTAELSGAGWCGRSVLGGRSGGAVAAVLRRDRRRRHSASVGTGRRSSAESALGPLQMHQSAVLISDKNREGLTATP